MVIGMCHSHPSEFMGVEFGRREPFVELEVDGPGAGIDAELAIGAIIVLPARMRIREEVIDQFFDGAFQGQTTLGCPNGGRLPSRLQSDDQSPVPALPGCAIVVPSAFNFQREFKDPRSNAHPLPRTDTTILQWFSLGTQAL